MLLVNMLTRHLQHVRLYFWSKSKQGLILYCDTSKGAITCHPRNLWLLCATGAVASGHTASQAHVCMHKCAHCGHQPEVALKVVLRKACWEVRLCKRVPQTLLDASWQESEFIDEEGCTAERKPADEEYLGRLASAQTQGKQLAKHASF